MKRSSAFTLLVLLMANPVDGQWEMINLGEEGYRSSIDFVSDDVGWMTEWNNGMILWKTEDFGRTEVPVEITVLENGNIVGMDFLSESTGWVLAHDRVSDSAKLLRTEDGGVGWQVKDVPVKADLLDVLDINAIILAVQSSITNDTRVIRTMDGGVNWMDITPAGVGKEDNIRSIDFVDEELILVTMAHRKVFRSTDGGKSWDQLWHIFDEFSELRVINDSLVYSVGRDENGLYFCESKDTCRTWTIKFQSKTGIQYRYISPDRLFFFDNVLGNVLLSTDAGESREIIPGLMAGRGSDIYINSRNEGLIRGFFPLNGSWEYQTQGIISFRKESASDVWDLTKLTYTFESTYFLDESKGFAAGGARIGFGGSTGGIFMTRDGGKSWENCLHLGFGQPPVTSIQFADDKTGFIVATKLYKSVDGGFHWEPLEFEEVSDLSVYFVNENKGFVIGNDGDAKAAIYQSNDGGKYWNKVWERNYELPDESSFSIHFKGAEGWATAPGLLLRYTGGQWQEVGSPTTTPMNKVLFQDAQSGWVVAGQAENTSTLFRTTNGGKNWQSTQMGYKILDICFVDGMNGWAVGRDTIDYDDYGFIIQTGHGVILGTSDGGVSWEVQEEGLPRKINAIHYRDGYAWAVGDAGQILRAPGYVFPMSAAFEVAVPSTFRLEQPYPNPTTGSTFIRFHLPVHTLVNLSIYNMAGHKVATLIKGKQSAGWHKIQWNTDQYEKGVYVYRLTAGDFAGQKLLILQ